ncbi:protein jagged-1b-like [Mercenaria mercenaria]|uniref:protein jagged-1b-like n=1 Tax=Mercenaria mercenaria TaxID=6596 RepID=UPI00234F8BFB|nr:protein jagged-1b-like [Mercenaria mercenaria]
MRSGELSGMVLAFVFLFCHLSFAESEQQLHRLKSSEQQLRRYLFSDLAGNGSSWASCGQCLHGSCSYGTYNGHFTRVCRCHDGWTGDACDKHIADDGRCRRASDCTTVTCNQGDKVVCYLNTVCACVPERSGHSIKDRNMHSMQPMSMSSQSHCGQHHCIHGSCHYSQHNGVEYYRCTCKHGWTGNACDTWIGNTDMTGNHGSSQANCGLHQCIHGDCSYSMQNGIEFYHTCKCHYGWTGDACDKSTAAQTTQSSIVHQHHYYDPACNNHGQMTSSGCNCHDSWSGDICQYPPGSGHYDYCHQHCAHGACVGYNGNNGYYYNCKCDHGWHGSYCTQEYAPHGTIQCHNTYCVHGTCGYHYDQSGHRWNYHCVCHHGWDGKHCDQQLTSKYPMT